MGRRATRVWARVLPLAVLGTGCLVRIERVRDPGFAFDEAREDAEAVRGRPGPARELNLVAYNPHEGKLVRISVPLWLVRAQRPAALDQDLGLELEGDEDRRLVRRLRQHARWEELQRAALGPLLEVYEDGGERVFVWLR
jgi:hypothetical protein